MKIERFKELIEKGLSLDLLYVLQKVREGIKIEGGKIDNLLITLERKGYILGGAITLEGAKLLDTLGDTKVSMKKAEDPFEKWWKAYPGTSEFEYKNRKFPGTRALRLKKEDCRVKFEKIIKEGITAEDMHKALEKEVQQKKDESLRTGQNKLAFMQNTLTYLNQRTFEPYIELIKESKPISQAGNSVDI